MNDKKLDGAGENVISRLEVVDVYDGRRTALAEFNGRIEAPNWTRDGRRLIYNSGGRLVSFDLETRESAIIDTGFADRCNNDHVLSSDNTKLAFSHHTAEDGRSRIYIIPIEGGRPTLITPLGPSYLHGWSPDGKLVAFLTYRKDDVAPDAHPPNRHVSIRIMSSDGGEIRTISELFGGQGTINVNSWAPDSRRLAFVSYELKGS